MERFLGYGTCSSEYDGRRHICLLLCEYLMYQLFANEQATIGVMQKAVCMNELQSVNYLKQNFYGKDFLSFLNGKRLEMSLNDNEYNTLLSNRLFTMEMVKSPAGYYRDQNISLICDIAYMQRFFTPLDIGAYGKVIRTQMPLFWGMRGGITEQVVNCTIGMVSVCLESGETDLKKIKDSIIESV